MPDNRYALVPNSPRIPHAGIRVGEIIAYRAWEYVEPLELKSISMRYLWMPGINEAVLYDGAEQIIDERVLHNPIANEYCGFYAFKTAEAVHKEFQPLWTRIYGIYGTVALWGVVIEHEQGYRAQYARIISIDAIGRSIGFVPPRNLLNKLQVKFGVPATSIANKWWRRWLRIG